MSSPLTRSRLILIAVVAFVIGLGVGLGAGYVSISPKTTTVSATVPTTITKTKATTLTMTSTVTSTTTLTTTVPSITTATKTIEKTLTTTSITTTTVTLTTTMPVTYTKTITRTVTATSAAPMSLLELAEAIRSGKINVGNKYGLALGERYHNIHVNVLGLSCTTCHKGNAPSKDYIYINIDRVIARMTNRGMPGPVDRAVCLACHKEGGIATKFYGPFYGEGHASGAGG